MHFNIIDLEQNTQAWLDFRRNKIGASQASAILGISPYRTRLQVWEEITGTSKQSDNANMRHGREMEPIIRNWFNEKQGVDFKPLVVQSIQYAELISSLDGYEPDSGAVLEIKCANREAHKEAQKGKVPDHYFAQVQHQLMVTKANMAFYVSHHVEENLVITIEPDSGYIDALLKEELKFLQSIYDFKPPEPEERDWVEIDNSFLAGCAKTYKRLHEQIAHLEEEKEMMRKFLIQDLKNKRNRIEGLKIEKTTPKGQIDIEKLIEAYSIQDADRFRKPGSDRWRITVS